MMNILSNFFNRFKNDGMRLEVSKAWEISPVTDYELFLKSLFVFTTGNTILYFEGTEEKNLENFLENKIVSNPLKIFQGTIWPKPKKFHIVLSKQNLGELLEHLEKYPVGHFCDHLHVHDGKKILLEWYDVFTGDSIITANPEIAEEKIKQFSSKLGSKYHFIEFDR